MKDKNMENVIIYGAGKMGQAYLQFLKKHMLDSGVKAFCDIRAEEIGHIGPLPVITYSEAAKMKIPFVVAVRKEVKDDVLDMLDRDRQAYYDGLDKLIVDTLHLVDRTAYERELCAISHIDTMDGYFQEADTENGLRFFWEGQCRNMFRQLDLSNVVELACGRGRHVPRYIGRAGKITLVDILGKNVDICRARFSQYQNVSYVVNNGYDLSDLSDGVYSSLFTYDSMVHFELLDIANYLKETYRILQTGGKALFHHSNNDSDYKASYDSAFEARSFMNKNIFAYLAYRAGFEIVEQRVVDWVVPGLDCLTLVKKK